MTASYTTLPLKVHQIIFSQVPLRTFASLRLVCKALREVAENDDYWLQQIQTCFGTRFLEIFQDYTPFSAFIALCHVKPYLFITESGLSQEPIVDDIDDYEKQAEVEHSLAWSGPPRWRATWQNTLSRPIEAIESFTSMHIMPEYIYALSNKGQMSFRMLDAPSEIAETPSIRGIKYAMLSTSPWNIAGITKNNKIVEWNTDSIVPARFVSPDDFEELREKIAEFHQPKLPYRAPSLEQFKFKQVDAGTDITACLTECNQVFFWNFRWPLFTSKTDGAYTLEGVILLPKLGKRIIEIAAGDHFVIALTEDQSVYLCKIPKTEEYTSFAKEYEKPYPKLCSKGKDKNWDIRTSNKVGPAMASYLDKKIQEKMHWLRLDKFCDDVSASGTQLDGSNIWNQNGLRHLVSKAVRIKHVYASGEYFIVVDPDAGEEDNAVKKGIVMIGKVDDLESTIVLPELQGQQVISIGRGEAYKKLVWNAQTRSGKVFLWSECFYIPITYKQYTDQVLSDNSGTYQEAGILLPSQCC